MTFGHRTYVSFFTLAASSLLISCTPSVEAPHPENETTNETSELPKLALAPAPVDRSQLLISVAKAASAAALGQDDAEAQRELNGNLFEVRMRFGCLGVPSQEPETAHFDVTFDPEKRTLRIRASPDIDLGRLAVTKKDEKAVEAVEGFWVSQPWILSAGCAAVPAQPDRPEGGDAGNDKEKSKGGEAALRESQSVTSADHTILARTVGIAQFFTDTDARTIRRKGRAYEVTKLLRDDERPSTKGYNLVLSGRLRGLPERKVITCITRDRFLPPECMISVTFHRIWVEDPTDKRVLAEWNQ